MMDINIPTTYKIDSRSTEFLELFKNKIDLIFSNFQSCSDEFSEYRKIISREQIEFDKQINNIFSASTI